MCRLGRGQGLPPLTLVRVRFWPPQSPVHVEFHLGIPGALTWGSERCTGPEKAQLEGARGRGGGHGLRGGLLLAAKPSPTEGRGP